jgi:hypothetical protein
MEPSSALRVTPPAREAEWPPQGRASGTTPDVVLFDWFPLCFGQLRDKLSGGKHEMLGAGSHRA